MMNNRFAVSLIAASLLASGAAYAQSTTATGAGLEIPNAVITSIQGERVPSVRVRERVVVGEPLPATVELRPVPNYTQYRYAVVNDRRVIVEPRTRKIIRIID